MCLASVDDFFVDEVWTKVGSQKCITCHKVGGDAEDSNFVLKDPLRSQGAARLDDLKHNREAFTKMARAKEKEGYRLLVKVSGGLDHGGGDVFPSGSAGYGILKEFASIVNAPHKSIVKPGATSTAEERPFFDGVTMLDDRRLLRRAALSLVGRLPTADENAAVAKSGRAALPAILDKMMQEEAFYERLCEGFNDIFLTVGFIGNPDQVVLSYEYFTKTRGWPARHDLSHIADAGARKKAEYKLTDDYREGLRTEAKQLVDYIVRNDRPFTEIVTADYIMVTPLSARGYGIFDEVREKFKDPDDPREFIPVKLKALTGRSKRADQESATGFYPHAGMLSTFQYLRRYPTTETNRNRLRVRMYYLHFLGVDVLELAARVADAAAVTAKYEIPTMQASECVVCHKTIDPVAGLFQDYYDFEGTYGRRKDGWYKDMFAAGFEGEDLPESERWRALQWLGERTAKDPRFATTMVEHVYYILTGRKVLPPPKDLEDPMYEARQRAYAAQRCVVETIAAKFARDGFNLKHVFQDWIASDFYRVDGLTTSVDDPLRRAELDDVGIVRMLAPEQLERKIEAVFGERWGHLGGQLASLYGGIDSKEVTERATDPSGAMGAIQRNMSDDVATKRVPLDFALPSAERRLFPGIEPTTLPGKSAEDDAAIRKAIVHLHQHILGKTDAVDSADVERTWRLFTSILADAGDAPNRTTRNAYVRADNRNVPDPDYTLRAWRGVVTYLLRREEFLYE